MTTKKEIRMQVKESFKACRSDDLIASSLAICKTIYDRVTALDKPDAVVLLYWPLPDEVLVSTVIERLYREGYTILLPVVSGQTLLLRKYCGHEKLAVGPFGILEPVGEEFDDYASIDLTFVPGRAFSADGCRLGRGNGFYDRLLPSISSPKIGVCFKFQLMEQVPTDLFDVKLDDVIRG